MRVLCLNAWGGRLAGPLLSYVAACDPDIACLQEVVRTPGHGRGWLTYRDDGAALPQRANLLDELGRALPGHAATFCPAARGALHDGGRAIASEWGLATFVRAGLPVIAQAQGFVHGAFSPDGFGEHPRSRSAHAVRVFSDALAAPVTVAHMHGLRDPAGKADTPARAAQADALAGLVRSVAGAGDRLVVCGDFNVLPGSVTFARLAALGLADLVTGRGHAGTRTSHYAKPHRFADYMLVNPRVAVVAFEVVEAPEVSDHRALVLDLA